MPRFIVEISDPMGCQPLVAEIDAEREGKAIVKALQTEFWTLEPYAAANGEQWHTVTVKVSPPQEWEDDDE